MPGWDVFRCQMCSLCRLRWYLWTVNSMTCFWIPPCNALHQFRISIWGHEVEMMTRKNRSNIETIECIRMHATSLRHLLNSDMTRALIIRSTIPHQVGCEYSSWIYFGWKCWSRANAMMPSHKHIICTFLQSSLWHEDDGNTACTHRWSATW